MMITLTIAMDGLPVSILIIKSNLIQRRNSQDKISIYQKSSKNQRGGISANDYVYHVLSHVS